MDSWDPRADAWLAGFADGEACFLISFRRVTDSYHGRPHACPRFTINLRADDMPVLAKLAATFGGRLSFNQRGDFARYFWHVTRKADLTGLVDYFDQFPPRAKKARDYALWREAVRVYLDQGGADGFAELCAIGEELKVGRVYEPPKLRAVS